MAKTGCTCLLRGLAILATLLASLIMGLNRQKIDSFPISFQVDFTDSPAFTYFVIANSIATVYGVPVLCLPDTSLLWRLIAAVDVVFTMLLASACSAALAIADVNIKGNPHVNWAPFCNQFPDYCHRAVGAIIAGFIGVGIYMVLVLYSLHVVINPLLMPKF